MSRHHHAYTEASSLDYDVQHRSAKELEDLYGIQFYENPDVKKGPVVDSVTGKEYKTIQEWMAAQVEEEHWSEYSHHEISNKFDEDF